MDGIRLQHIALWAVASCTAALLAGCVSNGGSTVITFDQQKTALTLIRKGDGTDAIEKALNAGQADLLRDQANAPKETNVLVACGARPFVKEGAVGPILGLLLGSAINVLTERIDAALQKRIEQYSHAYSAQQSTSIYDSFNSNKPNEITTDYTCLRFVRAMKAGDSEALMDFVASIKVVNSAWLEVRPERLYFSQPVALSSNGRYGIAVKLKATSIHRVNAAGARTVVFDDVIAKEKINIATRSYFLKYYEDDKNRPVIRLPLLPYSVPTLDTAREFTTFEVSVAETGMPSDGLVLFAKAFAGAREDIAKVLAAAANESLGWEGEK